jgi:protein-disulfide isomerase-like protein with CxxC motif
VPIQVTYITDPACAESWGIEPMVRRLMADFGDQLHWRFVMGGLGREWGEEDWHRMMAGWLRGAEQSGMPFDPLIWRDAPLRSSYPACMAMHAAADQSPGDGGYAYLRALREGIFCFRRKLDTPDSLIDVARAVGLDVERFKLDISSNAIVEAFGNDLEIARDVPETARAAGAVVVAGGKERVAFPTLYFAGPDGARREVYGSHPYADYRAAAEAAGAEATSDANPGVLDALRRFGRMATREIEEVCGLKGPRAEGELWQLALDFEVRPTRVLTGWLWELAG